MSQNPEAATVSESAWIHERATACVFVMGSPRSGTSAFSWALAQHPTMVTGPESDFPFFLARRGFLEGAWNEANRRNDAWIARHGVTCDEFMGAVGIGLDQLFRSRYGDRRWVDSTPASVLAAPQLAQMFPRAKFFHLLRDGRAAVASMMNSGFDARIARDFGFACETWATYAMKGHRFSVERPDRCLEFRQEDMARDPVPILERSLEFLEAEPCEKCAAFLQKGRINSSYGNDKPEDVRQQKPHENAPKTPWVGWSDAWKETFRSVCGDTQQTLGYDLSLDG